MDAFVPPLLALVVLLKSLSVCQDIQFEIVFGLVFAHSQVDISASRSSTFHPYILPVIAGCSGVARLAGPELEHDSPICSDRASLCQSKADGLMITLSR